MGHCSEFSYALWATTVNLVVRYGYYTRFGYSLVAIARNEAVQLKSVMISVLWALAHHLVIALWAIAQDLVMRYGP